MGALGVGGFAPRVAQSVELEADGLFEVAGLERGLDQAGRRPAVAGGRLERFATLARRVVPAAGEEVVPAEVRFDRERQGVELEGMADGGDGFVMPAEGGQGTFARRTRSPRGPFG